MPFSFRDATPVHANLWGAVLAALLFMGPLSANAWAHQCDASPMELEVGETESYVIGAGGVTTDYEVTGNTNSSVASITPQERIGVEDGNFTIEALSPGETQITINWDGTAYGEGQEVGDCVVIVEVSAPPEANLFIVKSLGAGTGILHPGDEFDFTIDVGNDGPADAENVTVTDQLPDLVTFISADAQQGTCSHSFGTVTCNVGTLPDGGEVLVDIFVEATQAGSATNNVTVTGDPADSRTDFVNFHVFNEADLETTFEDDGESPAAGGTYTFRVDLSNLGPDAALSSETTIDLPPELLFESATPEEDCETEDDGDGETVTCTTENVEADGERTIEVGTQVEGDPGDQVTITGATTTGEDTDDPEDGNNSFQITRTIEESSPEADLALTMEDSGPPVANGLYEVQATVVNDGPDQAGRVELTVDFPDDVFNIFALDLLSGDEDTECETASSGGTETVTCIMNDMKPDEERAIFVTSRVMVAEEGTEVEVTGSTQTDDDTNDPNDENNSLLINRLTTETPPTDLEVTKSGNSEVVQGDTLWYNILIDNIGANPAEAVQMLDTPFMVGTPASNVEVLVDEVTVDPGGSCVLGFLGLGIRCDLGTLAPGENVVIWVPVIPSRTGTLRNRVQAFSRTTEANLLNNEDVVETDVLPEGQLVVEKTVEAGDIFSEVDFSPSYESISAGTPLEFFIAVENTSEDVAENVIVEDVLPNGFIDILPQITACEVTGNTVHCEMGNLSPGEKTFVSILTYPEELGLFENRATATSKNVPGSDDTAEVRVVDPEETIAATAEPAEQPADLGATGSVRFTFDNVSDTDMLISPSFRIEAGVDFSSIAASDGLCEDVDASKNGEAALRCVAVVDSSGSTQVDLGFEATALGTHTIAVDIGDFTDAAISTVTVQDTVSLELCGEKYWDRNGDGVRDDDDPGLDGVTIELLNEAGSVIGTTKTGTSDLNEDGVVDPFTEHGQFCFEDLPRGTYTVGEVVPPGFQQTAPGAPGTITVELTTGSQPPVRFGNALDSGEGDDDDDDDGDDPTDIPIPDSVAVDFGDLPDPRKDVPCPPGKTCYPTLWGSSGPWHVLDPDGPVLGAGVDDDVNGAPDATAEGDDALDGSDDEDGLVNHTIKADGSIQFEIEATVPPGSPAFLHAWVDLNDDGVLETDMAPPREHVLVRKAVANGLNTFTTDPGLVDPNEDLTYARFRISSTGAPFPFGPALDGEVEDYLLLGADFGDAPSRVDPDQPEFPGGYPTTLAQDGARHVAGFNVRLGDHIDADDEVDGSFNAREDDEDAQQNDEDGIRFLDGFTEETHSEAGAHVGVVPGTTTEVLPLPSVDGKLDAWVDWNRDGDWGDAGEQIFASEDIGPAMDEDDALEVSIPAAAVSGFTYARFRFSRQGELSPTGAAPSGEVEDYLVSIADVLNFDVQVAFSDVSGPQNYRLVALPGAIDTSLAQTLDGAPGTAWQAFWDDGSDEDFLVKFDGSETFTFRPGHGFWLIGTDSWTVEATVGAVPLDDNGMATVPLHGGWNIVSNPLARGVTWADVTAANGGALQTLWRWDGGFAEADTFRSAKTGKAFYFLNDQGLDELKVPRSGADAFGAVAARTDGDTPAALTLRAIQAGTRTSQVRVGLRSEAEEALDAYDQHAPPGRFERASLRLVAPGEAESERLRHLAHEWRPPDPEGQTFDLMLRAKDGPVTLKVSGQETVPEQAIVLIDEETGRSHDLLASNTVQVHPRDEMTPFTLVMGTDAYAEREAEKALPRELEFRPAYPNPFREHVRVAYALPEPMDVRLSVYDLLGRQVSVLADGEHQAGIHRLQWDGRNRAGQSVASGLYLLRLEAGGERHVQKVTLLR